MKRNSFSARRRQIIVMGASATAAAALVPSVASVAMAAHEPYITQGGDRIVVSGRILGAPGGQPLAGAQVEVWLTNARGVRNEATREVAITDGDGRYYVSLNTTGSPRLQYRVSHQGYTAQVTQLHTTGARQPSVSLTRDPAGATRAAFEMTLQPRGVVAAAAMDVVAL